MKYLALLTAILISACSGGGGGSKATSVSETTEELNTEPVQEQLVTTDEIQAQSNFDFRVDQDITLIVLTPDATDGVAHIYGASDPNGPSDKSYPDFLSRITSVTPSINPNAIFSYTGLENKLWVQWVPTDSNSLEQIVVIDILPNQYTYTVSLL